MPSWTDTLKLVGQTTQNVGQSASSVADAVANQSKPPTPPPPVTSPFSFSTDNQYLPWIIIGGIVLVGAIMITRRRLKRYGRNPIRRRR